MGKKRFPEGFPVPGLRLSSWQPAEGSITVFTTRGVRSEKPTSPPGVGLAPKGTLLITRLSDTGYVSRMYQIHRTGSVCFMSLVPGLQGAKCT